MKFYLIDDDANVCNILKIIIQQKKLGEVCGMATGWTRWRTSSSSSRIL